MAANKRTGIICNVRCVSNKVDQAKDDVRSICLNFDIRGEDTAGDMKNLGKGNNLNINNLTPGDYVQLCKAFGVSKIDDDTPIIAELFSATQHEDKEAWTTAMARKDKSVSEDQADVTAFEETEKQEAIRKGQENQTTIPEDGCSADTPEVLSGKQLVFLEKNRNKTPEIATLVERALAASGVDMISRLPKVVATGLIGDIKKRKE